jgi:hypothetical protein
MRLGLYIPPFDELADPALVARLCAEAEEAGWDGAFVWDQLHWREPVAAVGDPQIACERPGRRARASLCRRQYTSGFQREGEEIEAGREQEQRAVADDERGVLEGPTQ